jgi:hypothetical protein
MFTKLIKDLLFYCKVLKTKLIGTQKSNKRKYNSSKRSLYRASIYITNNKRKTKKGIELDWIESCYYINRQNESYSCISR